MLGSGELAQESNRTRKIVVILLRDSKGRDFSSAQPVEEVFRILGDMIVDRFLLAPHGPTTCVVLRYLDEDLHEHGPPLEVRGRWFGSIGEDSMQVVVIDDDGKRLRLFELGEDALLETKAPPLPAAVIADSVVLSDAVVFLGCHSDESEAHLQREKLFSLDLRAANPDWQGAPMWYDGDDFIPRKAIDELFVDGDRLLAIDDIVFPRYSLIYAIRDRTQLELMQAVQMVDHTSYESVRAATLGRRWLAVISVGINHGTWMQFVAVLERDSLAERVCYDYSIDPFEGRDAPRRASASSTCASTSRPRWSPTGGAVRRVRRFATARSRASRASTECCACAGETCVWPSSCPSRARIDCSGSS
jgi:hypothetical protein